jgi:hypothetical protein
VVLGGMGVNHGLHGRIVQPAGGPGVSPVSSPPPWAFGAMLCSNHNPNKGAP